MYDDNTVKVDELDQDLELDLELETELNQDLEPEIEQRVDSKIYKNVKEKSIEKKPIKITSRKKVNNKKDLAKRFKFICATLLTGAIVTSFARMGFDIKEQKELKEFYTEGYSSVTANTHSATEPGKYWYDYREIAESLAEAEGDFDANLYGVYSNIGWNESSKIDQMDMVLMECHHLGLTQYSDFTTYCKDKGLCDKNGNVNATAYRKAIKEYLRTLREKKEIEQEVENFKQGL